MAMAFSTRLYFFHFATSNMRRRMSGRRNRYKVYHYQLTMKEDFFQTKKKKRERLMSMNKRQPNNSTKTQPETQIVFFSIWMVKLTTLMMSHPSIK
jgi:hypothetical protein